ncbi:MAG: RluA family pseudouridine synthase, partial [Oscillospiraceae bacterium]|nr:RluA family pseudouridine synthase [Oscillospiraceae bacterium]
MEETVPFCVGPLQEGWTLWDFLKAQGVSSSYIRKVKRAQPGITLRGEHKNTNERVHAGEVYELPLPQAEETDVVGEDIPTQVVYESAFAIVFEKAAGMAVHPTLGYPSGTLANAAVGLFEKRGEKRPFRPVNRLDVGTSGLVLAAKNGLAAPFLARSAVKEYMAMVTGELPPGPGCIHAPIGRCADSIIRRRVSAEGKPSETQYTVLAAAGGLSLIRCIPVTGRTHQIRVHFASIGHPLAGDGLYGTPHRQLRRHALHCSALQFEEPDGYRALLRSPLPPDM